MVLVRGDQPRWSVNASVAFVKARRAIRQAIRASTIADLDREDVISADLHRGCGVEDESRESPSVLAEVLAVHVHVRDLENALEVDIDAVLWIRGRDREVRAVPRIGVLGYAGDLVPGVRHGNAGPRGVIVGTYFGAREAVASDELPRPLQCHLRPVRAAGARRTTRSGRSTRGDGTAHRLDTAGRESRAAGRRCASGREGAARRRCSASRGYATTDGRAARRGGTARRGRAACCGGASTDGRAARRGGTTRRGRAACCGGASRATGSASARGKLELLVSGAVPGPLHDGRPVRRSAQAHFGYLSTVMRGQADCARRHA